MRKVQRHITSAFVLVLGATAGCAQSAPCDNPATVNGSPDPAAPGVSIIFHDGIDAATEAPQLATKYGFTVTSTFGNLAFSEDLSPDQVEKLRCESSVAIIEYNAVVVGHG